MNIRKMGGGKTAYMSIAVVAAAALALFVYTPRAASQAGQAPSGAPPAQGAQAGRGGRGGGGGFTHPAPADYNDNAGFTSLFNGTDLSGWTSDGQNWSAKDGAIYAQSTCEKPTGTIYIYSDIGLAGDFDLKVRMKGTESVNSGIQYRSWLTEDLNAPHFPGRGRGGAGRGPGAPGGAARGGQAGGAAAAAGRGGFGGRGQAGPCPSGQPRGTPPDRAMEAKYDMGGPQYDFDNTDRYPGQFYEQASGRGIV